MSLKCPSFLNIEIINKDGKVEFEINRSINHTQRNIPIVSNLAWSLKMAPFDTMIDKMYMVLISKENSNKEKECILSTAKMDRYSAKKQ